MAATFIHTCYRILDPARSEDFYVNKLGMKKVGEMHFDTATNTVVVNFEQLAKRTVGMSGHAVGRCPHPMTGSTVNTICVLTRPPRALVTVTS